jgi:flavin-binding protein dodecin
LISKEDVMSVYRLTKLIGTSTESWEDAAATAVKTARKTLRDLRVAEVVEQDIHIDGNGGITYRTKLRLSFKYEKSRTGRSHVPARPGDGGSSNSHWTSQELVVIAVPHLHWMQQQLDETCHIVVRQGRDVRFLTSVEAESSPYESPARTGTVPPAHLTSDGKAFLGRPARRRVRPALPRQGFRNSDWVPMSSPSCVEISTQPADASMG